MTGVVLASGAHDETVDRAPIDLRIEDSLKSLAMPIRRVSAAMVAVLIGSLTVHVLLVTMAVVASRVTVTPPQQEIAVEIVQDVPKPPALRTAAEVESTKLPPTKFVADRPAPEQVVKTEPPEMSSPKPQPVGAKEIEDLRQELADLRAQQAALASASESSRKAATANPRTGPLAGSLQAIALPAVGEGGGDVVGYQELIFSQLAKAKGLGETLGEWHGPAGTTGVRFQIDEDGRLMRAEIAVSSGNAALDMEALAIVHRAAPFPLPPKDAAHSFVANVNFLSPK